MPSSDLSSYFRSLRLSQNQLYRMQTAQSHLRLRWDRYRQLQGPNLRYTRACIQFDSASDSIHWSESMEFIQAARPFRRGLPSAGGGGVVIRPTLATDGLTEVSNDMIRMRWGWITKSSEEIKGATGQFGGGSYGTISSAVIYADSHNKLSYPLSYGHDQNQQWRNGSALAFRDNKFNVQTEYAREVIPNSRLQAALSM